MNGSLSLRSGVLYVGRHELTAHVGAYDFDGHSVSPGFSFRGADGEPARVSGLSVDEDRVLWIADSHGPAVRMFTVFGREIGGFRGRTGGDSILPHDARCRLDGLVDNLLVEVNEDERFLVTVSRGERRHAVQVFHPDGTWRESLRPEGDPQGKFFDARRVACRDRFLYVCEVGAGRIQVFRDFEFHFAFRVPVPSGQRFEPTAIAALSDGRLAVATGGEHSALLLLDEGGRLLRVLAEGGAEEGQVFQPEDVAVEESGLDRRTRLAVLDRDADRVQVFTMEGRCYGALEDLPGEAQ